MNNYRSAYKETLNRWALNMLKWIRQNIGLVAHVFVKIYHFAWYLSHPHPPSHPTPPPKKATLPQQAMLHLASGITFGENASNQL